MARREPGAPDKMYCAALDLFAGRRFGATTADLAAAAPDRGASWQGSRDQDHPRLGDRGIFSNETLQGWELLKLMKLSHVFSGASSVRGLESTTARLAAGFVVSIFFIAFNGWLADDEPRDLVELLREMMDALGAGDGLATLAKSWGALVVG